MTQGSFISKCVSAIGMSIFSLVVALPAQAVDMVAPGETLEFMQAEGGVRECRATDRDQEFFCGDVATVWLSEAPLPPLLPPHGPRKAIQMTSSFT